MIEKITDPKTRERAARLADAIRDARLTGHTTGLLSGAERDLLLAVEVRLGARADETIAPAAHIRGLDLARLAVAEIERDAKATASTRTGDV